MEYICCISPVYLSVASSLDTYFFTLHAIALVGKDEE